ncbi:hypothetical protein N9H69_00825 [Flavobacteriaceae bacterium]|nr:hypothetical protein [Flavobacteriaceae bacterium]MDB3862114.1 hypothetical protein [Flavobacteriaceae bacterium]MDC3354521.1 hypothetical protein [Flavobacteriaceae bacterium]
MKSIILMLFASQKELQELSDDLENVDWSSFPIGKEFGIWIPFTIILVVFFGFRFLAKSIERN